MCLVENYRSHGKIVDAEKGKEMKQNNDVMGPHDQAWSTFPFSYSYFKSSKFSFYRAHLLSVLLS